MAIYRQDLEIQLRQVYGIVPKTEYLYCPRSRRCSSVPETEYQYYF